MISFVPLADRSLPLLAAKASDRQRGCSVNRSVCPCDTENQIFGCWVVMNKHLPVFIPHPRVGLALRLIKGTFFHVCLFCQSPGFFPSFPTPQVGFGLGGSSCRTKLLHATTKSAEVGWKLVDYGGLMSCVGRGEASGNTEWVKLTSGTGRRKPEVQKRHRGGTYVLSVTSSAVYSSWRDVSRSKTWFRSHMPFSLLSEEVKTSLGQEKEETRSWCIVWEIKQGLMHSLGLATMPFLPASLLQAEGGFCISLTILRVCVWTSGQGSLAYLRLYFHNHAHLHN